MQAIARGRYLEGGMVTRALRSSVRQEAKHFLFRCVMRHRITWKNFEYSDFRVIRSHFNEIKNVENSRAVWPLGCDSKKSQNASTPAVQKKNEPREPHPHTRAIDASIRDERETLMTPLLRLSAGTGTSRKPADARGHVHALHTPGAAELFRVRALYFARAARSSRSGGFAPSPAPNQTPGRCSLFFFRFCRGRWASVVGEFGVWRLRALHFFCCECAGVGEVFDSCWLGRKSFDWGAGAAVRLSSRSGCAGTLR